LVVTEVPVADESLAQGERALALGRHDVVHPQVVLGDVELGGGARGGDLAAIRRVPGERSDR
jgi:hypothetical protein